MIHKNIKAREIAGVAALIEMLDCIGNHDIMENHVAEILVEYELELRALVNVYT